MKTKLNRAVFLLALFAIACSGGKTPLPVETTIGSLNSVEKVKTVQLADKSVRLKENEEFYVLSFTGKNEFILNGPMDQTEPRRALVDKDGHEYWPVYYGTLSEEGIISNEDWMISGGHLTGNDQGQLVYVECKMTLPEPEFMLIYILPLKSRDIALRDGDVLYPL
ncbi:MAG: hypothetical protein ACOYXB_05175 [Bacteroidota bacterium]